MDPLATACTARSEPYCAFMYTVITGASYGHFECASTDTTFEVISTLAEDTIFSSATRARSSEANDGVSSIFVSSRSPTTTLTVTPDSEPTSEPESATEPPESTSSPVVAPSPSQQQGPGPFGNAGVEVRGWGNALVGGVVGVLAALVG